MFSKRRRQRVAQRRSANVERKTQPFEKMPNTAGRRMLLVQNDQNWDSHGRKIDISWLSATPSDFPVACKDEAKRGLRCAWARSIRFILRSKY
jgi:hypothetical protein